MFGHLLPSRLAFLWTLLALTAVTAAQPLAERLPADAQVYVGWCGTDQMPAGYKDSHLQALVRDIDLGKTLAGMFQGMVRSGMIDNARDREQMLLVSSVMMTAWNRPVAVYFGGMVMPPEGAAQPPMPRFAVICDAGNAAAAQKLQTEVGKLLESAGEGVPLAPEVIGRYVVVALGPAAQALPELVELLQAQTVPAGKSLKDAPRFQQMMKKAGSDPALTVYVDVAGLVKLADTVAAAEHRGMVKAIEAGNEEAKKQGAKPEELTPVPQDPWPAQRDALGLADIKQAIFTGGFDRKDWLWSCYIESPAPRRGLATLFNGQPLDPALLKLVPRSAAWAGGWGLDVPGLFKEVRTGLGKVNAEALGEFNQGLAEFNQKIGMDLEADLLNHLGPSWVYYSDASVGGTGFWGMVGVNRLRNGPALEKALQTLDRKVNQLVAQMGGPDAPRFSLRTCPAEGATIHYLAIPMVTPAWAVHDGNLYVALYPQVIASAIAGAKQGGPSLKDHPEFTALRQRLGVESVQSFTYADLPRTVADGYGMSLFFSRLGLGFFDMMGADSPPMLIPPMHELKPHLAATGGFAWATADGWYFRSLSPFPGAEMIGSQQNFTVAQSALAAGIMLPALGAARKTAIQMKTNTEARSISQAAVLYAQGNNNILAPDMQVMVKGNYIPVETLLPPDTRAPAGFHQMPDAQQKAWIAANTKWVYLGKDRPDNTDSQEIIVYLSPRYAFKGMISVAFGDNHVEMMPVGRVMQMVREQEVKRAAEKAKQP